MRRILRLPEGLSHLVTLALAFVLSLGQSALAQDSTSHRERAARVWPLGGLRAGTPTLVSVGVGAIYTQTRDFVGPFISIEPGIRAGRASAGYSMIAGNLAAGTIFRASFLRRYRGARLGNYAGLEAQYVFGLVGPRVGVFRSMVGDGYLLALDFGIGF